MGGDEGGDASGTTAFEAKAAGPLAEPHMQKMGIDWVTFEGWRMPYRSQGSGEHYRLIVAAKRAKLEKNPRVCEIPLKTGDLVLPPDHIEEPDLPRNGAISISDGNQKRGCSAENALRAA